jgi:hypothetical protein
MVQFTISLSVFLIAAGLAVASPLSASSVPRSYGFRALEGMEGGLYHGYVLPDGTLECVHNGTGKRTPIPPPPPGYLEVRSSGLTRRANGADCDISNVIADQANVAQGMTGNWLGGGREIETYVSNWFTYGDTQAYVC